MATPSLLLSVTQWEVTNRMGLQQSNYLKFIDKYTQSDQAIKKFFYAQKQYQISLNKGPYQTFCT
jgi:hypothetical protein